jgi:peptidyl-prolyl cis-trans isomerase A (cyclophilin A)
MRRLGGVEPWRHGALKAAMLTVAMAATVAATASVGPARLREGDAGVLRPYAKVDGPTLVVLETAKGSIALEIDLVHAPITSANFLKYVDTKLYDGGEFNRVVRPETETRTDFPIQVIQARIDQARRREASPAIPLERTSVTGLKHRDGAISMARSTSPDSAASDFFICIGDQPELDFGGKRNPDGQGFAVFGRVVAGMDVIKAIQAAPVHPGTQTPDPLVKILSAKRK